MEQAFISPFNIKEKMIIPEDVDLYMEYQKIKRKESKYSAAIRKAIVEEVENRLNLFDK